MLFSDCFGFPGVGAPDHRHFAHKYAHVKGHCVVHLGAQRHGADDISEGERNNLIVWTKNDGPSGPGPFRASPFRAAHS